MGIASKREATRHAPYNTALVERRGACGVQRATQAQSRHAIAVNARGSPSICASLIPLKSAFLVTDPELGHYLKLHAIMTDHSPLKVAMFNEYVAAAKWLRVPGELLMPPA